MRHARTGVRVHVRMGEERRNNRLVESGRARANQISLENHLLKIFDCDSSNDVSKSNQSNSGFWIPISFSGLPRGDKH